MLSNDVMGVIALAVVWVTTLLVAGAAAQRLVALAAQRRRMRPLAPGEVGVGLVEGDVAAGAGEIAVHRVEQVGRQAADDHDQRAIVFSDRSYAGEVLGGTLKQADGAELHVAPALDAEVWLRAEAVRAAAECPDSATFDSAYEQARKARGFARTVTAKAPEGARVWAFGEVRRGDPRTMRPWPDGKLLLATFDPRGWCGARITELAVFIVLVIAVAAGCTAIALYRPHFGLVSTIGGALCLAYFLLVQPAGTAVRDRALFPHEHVLRGSWVKGAEPHEQKAAATLLKGAP